MDAKKRAQALASYYRTQGKRIAYNIAWQKSHREQTRLAAAKWAEKNPSKVAAHRIVRNALRRGELTRGVCMVCGQENAEAHHEDYDKPLEITWLCRTHHRAHHRKAAVA